ncbi:lactonase family protein, partial [bacterium]|nr:lactonase family protein [bacterium]
MYSRIHILAIALAAVVTATFTTGAEARNIAGYLYTSLNGENTNQVVVFERFDDGSLGKQKTYSTGSKGGANRAAGGDAAGDFDSQGAIQIIDDYLLVVNAGGNTVSVFDLDRGTGKLGNRRNVDSQGARPVSIAYT